MKDPREHHYQIAHQRLPKLALHYRESFLTLMRQGGMAYLQWTWYQTGRLLSPEERLKADGLMLDFFEAEKYCGAVITMPKATHRTEAHIVAAISHRISGSIADEDPTDLECWGLRYFTLERGLEKEGVCGAVLGEWTKKGHANYGSCPVIDVGMFWATCIARIQRENESFNYNKETRPKGTYTEPNLLRYCHPAFWAL
jgi:hypothetical protein